MKEESNAFHYRGFIATWYDRLLESETNDIEFYTKIAAESGGKVLELACGTGRLLLPIRRLGVDIEGLDVSPDMLAICRQKLASENLTARLYEQNMVDFDTGRHYRTIFISGGSFQLIEETSDAMKTLKKIHDHLQPGGRLVLDIFCPWDQLRLNQDGQWRIRRMAANEDQEELWCYDCSYFDLENQVQQVRSKYELYRKRRLVDMFSGGMKLRWYGKHEFILMLEKAGFGCIEAETANIIARDGDAIVYRAGKD